MVQGLNVTGENNKIQILENGKKKDYRTIKGLTITINGNNNKVLIELPSNFIQTYIVMEGDNNSIHIKPSNHRYIRSTSFGMDNGGKITFGASISVYKNLHVVAKAGKRIDIGDECMFASDIIVRNDDGHVIVDRKTGKVLNKTSNIKIGDHVWIGTRSMILKGTSISSGSVVGAMSLVNKKFKEENVVLAGVPAKIVRHNVEWLRMNYQMYMQQQGKVY